LKLLLDTHIWLWSQLEPGRLGRRVRHLLDEETSELWLSPISAWEAWLLNAKGRINLTPEPATWIEKATRSLHEATLTHEIVIAAQQLALPHADPADRFLAATAQVLGLTLVTADQKLLGLGDIATHANR